MLTNWFKKYQHLSIRFKYIHKKQSLQKINLFLQIMQNKMTIIWLFV